MARLQGALDPGAIKYSTFEPHLGIRRSTLNYARVETARPLEPLRRSSRVKVKSRNLSRPGNEYSSYAVVHTCTYNNTWLCYVVSVYQWFTCKKQHKQFNNVDSASSITYMFCVFIALFGHWVCGESWLAVKPTAPVLKAGHPVFSFYVS